MNETAWNRLMGKIQQNNVIPIIGPQLLVDADGQSLQARIAARLLQDCGKEPGEAPLPPFRELNVAVSQLKGSVDHADLYDCVHDALRKVTSAGDFTMPEPIRQLAQIADFRLFVTLTPDDLLARGLRQRCAVNEIIHAPNLPTSEVKDLPKDWRGQNNEVYLLYLFGKLCLAPTFAIHDEDFLEYAHNLIVNGNTMHSMFLAELQQRDLLLIGCDFPEWLSRFMLRATARERLSQNGRRQWLIEQLKPEEGLSFFLSGCGKNIEVLSDIPPVEFVAELHRRWMAEHDGGKSDMDLVKDEVVPRGAMFFISYSRATDLPCAEALYQALLGRGVTESEVWFDRKTIEPGQDFQRRILDGIHSCRYFLPLLSRATDRREEGFVFREWDAANQRMPGMNYDFLLPVIVDTDFDPECYTARPARVWTDRNLDFAHAPEGRPDGRLEAKLKKLVRDSRGGKPS